MYKCLLYVKNCFQAERDAKYVMNLYHNVLSTKMNAKILDVGCGPGNITVNCLAPYFIKTANKIVGADISTEMINFANKTYGNNSKITFQKMDILNQGQQSQFFESFDMIFSFYCLQFVNDHRKAFINMHNMLKPGGDILLAFILKCPVPHIYKSLLRENKWKLYLNDFMKLYPTQNVINVEEHYGNLLKNVGFEVYSCVTKKRIYVYSKENFKNIMVAINPFVIPEALEEDFALAHVQFMKDNDHIHTSDDSNEYFHFPYTLLIVHASKPIVCK